jgi:hypothetical protein
VVGWPWPSGAHEQGLRLPGKQVGRGGGAAGQGDAGEQLAPRGRREVNQAAEVDRVAGAGGAQATVTRRPRGRKLR